MKFFWLLFVLTLAYQAGGEEVEITAKRQEDSAKAVLVVVHIRSLIQLSGLDEKILREQAIEFLKAKGIAAEWANPDNKSTTQLLKAYLGTGLACGCTIAAAQTGEGYRLKTLCSASRREVKDPKAPPTAQNSEMKPLWEKGMESEAA